MTTVTTHALSSPPPTAADPVLEEVIRGLSARPKTLPCKLLYDASGSELFDRICTLPEYYLTRTESTILRDHAHAIAERIPAGAALVELGSGSSAKTRILLDALPQLSAYVPVDISRDHLFASAEALRQEYGRIDVLPVLADYTRPFDLPSLPSGVARIAFFPGSTIGNFDPWDAADFLRRLCELMGGTANLLIGVDLRKEVDVLLSAYDDAQGVTAAFNLNLLHRINHTWNGNFDVDRFAHLALWDDRHGRMEMHLVSVGAQRVTIAGQTFDFSDGETICTEHSYKHTLHGFSALAAAAGWRVDHVWTDDQQWFSVQWLTAGK